MLRNIRTCLITLAVVLCCNSGVASALPRQDVTLHLPLIQRSQPVSAHSLLLRQIGLAGAERMTQECSWKTGVLAWGLVDMWEVTGDEQYLQWTQAWVDGCLARGATITHVNDVTLAYAALSVYRLKPDPRYWMLVERAVDYLANEAPRTQDGTLIHLSSMVWDDTLMGVIPFLVKLWQVTGEESYLAEAIAQVQLHAAHLQDPATGLYHHAWSEPANAFSGPFFWGRGNGWVLLAQAQLLAALPTDDVRRPALAAAFQRQAAALVERQAANGMWHTIVSRTDFYTETSATALIAAGLASGVAQGLLDATAARAVADGQAAVWRQVAANGVAGGVSGPTGPMDLEAPYNTIPISEFELYGQGVVLLLGAATQPAQ